jgi:rare lipoprotein A
VDFSRGCDKRAGFFIVRIAIAAGVTGAVAACSLNSIASSGGSQPKRTSVPDVAILPPETRTGVAIVPSASGFMVAASTALPQEAEVEEHEAKLRTKPYRRIGAPYEIAGSWYEPKEDPNYDRTGEASWYGAAFHGRITANGEIFDSSAISAAHPTLPLPSYVRVTNLENDRSIVVRVNDRGPFRHQRLIDVSEETARLLGFHTKGMTNVRVQYVAKAPLEGESKADLLASYRGPGANSGTAAMLASVQSPAAASVQHAGTTSVVAFAPEASQAQPVTDRSAAMQSLTQEQSAENRISMAFAAADEFFE